MANLVLVRHGLSTYNKIGLWTGWDNPPLTDEGKEDARKAGEVLKSFKFDYAYSSVLERAINTLKIILSTINQANLKIIETPNLNERNYGVYTAKNKWQVR